MVYQFHYIQCILCLLYTSDLSSRRGNVKKSHLISNKNRELLVLYLSVNLPSTTDKPDFLPFYGKDTGLRACVGLTFLPANPDTFCLHIQNYEPRKFTQKLIIQIKSNLNVIS